MTLVQRDARLSPFSLFKVSIRKDESDACNTGSICETGVMPDVADSVA